jgi:hypothetical protein
MTQKSSGPRKPGGGKIDKEERDRIIAKARQSWAEREQSYREQSLKIHPWVCARCAREFTLKNLHELTVHHKDHDHDNNPLDGSNWENLCLYCHDNEHRRHLDHLEGGGAEAGEKQKETGLNKPFAGLKDLLKDKKT